MPKFHERPDFYNGRNPETNKQTMRRLLRMEELGMDLVGYGEFGIKDVMSGLYIEKVWNYSDEQFDDYMKWVESLIK